MTTRTLERLPVLVVFFKFMLAMHKHRVSEGGTFLLIGITKPHSVGELMLTSSVFKGNS